MGNYITKSDIESEFGVANVAKWSNLDNDDAQANEARITESINYAEQSLDDRFRFGRYAVPIVANVSTLYVVKRWAAVLAGHWLATRRAVYANVSANVLSGINDLRESVFEEIAIYTSGQARLNAQLSETQPDAPQVV